MKVIEDAINRLKPFTKSKQVKTIVFSLCKLRDQLTPDSSHLSPRDIVRIKTINQQLRTLLAIKHISDELQTASFHTLCELVKALPEKNSPSHFSPVATTASRVTFCNSSFFIRQSASPEQVRKCVIANLTPE